MREGHCHAALCDTLTQISCSLSYKQLPSFICFMVSDRVNLSDHVVWSLQLANLLYPWTQLLTITSLTVELCIPVHIIKLGLWYVRQPDPITYNHVLEKVPISPPRQLQMLKQNACAVIQADFSTVVNDLHFRSGNSNICYRP